MSKKLIFGPKIILKIQFFEDFWGKIKLYSIHFFLNDAPRWGASFKKKMDAVEWDFTQKNAKKL